MQTQQELYGLMSKAVDVKKHHEMVDAMEKLGNADLSGVWYYHMNQAGSLSYLRPESCSLHATAMDLALRILYDRSYMLSFEEAEGICAAFSDQIMDPE